MSKAKVVREMNIGGSTTELFAEPQQGALYRPLHVSRTARIYPIQENELKTVSFLNTLTTVCFSIGAGLFMFIAGLWVEYAMNSQHAEGAKMFLRVISAICGVIGVVSIIIGVCALVSRRSEFNRIRSEVDPPTIL